MASGGRGLRTDAQRKDQNWEITRRKKEEGSRWMGWAWGADCGWILIECSKDEWGCNAVSARER